MTMNRDECECDIRAEEEDRLQDNAIEWLKENSPDFVWRYRIVKSATAKLQKMRTERYYPKDGSPPKYEESKEEKSLRRRIKHLVRYCDEAIEECILDTKDAELLAKDPYRYYGIDRKSFL